jgi:site-specific DNA-methyltransferase (adenine-specific)
VVNDHETVKPIALMRWLVRLVTPPGGLCFDPFTGSGSTGVAAALEGFLFAGAELDPAHAETARRRIEACGFEVDDPPDERPEAPAPPQGSLF